MKPTPDSMRQDPFETKEVEHLPQPVYFIQSPEDQTVLVAMNVEITEDKIKWFDTTRQRVMTFSERTQHEDGSMEFTRQEDPHSEPLGTYSLTPMSLEIYNEKVKRHLAAGKDFNSTEEVIQAFLDTQKNY